MGRVNRVWHRGWQLDLAVKSVSPSYLQRPEAVEQFQREAEVWVNKLQLHPNLVFCYYVRLLGGLPRVFVEYVDGGDLAEWVESGKLYEGGPQTALQRILDVAIQFAWGLHAIHTQGLVHQDVKPRNVLMTQAGVAKVTDFGIARARAAAESAMDAAGLRPDVTALAGTRSYQSPEQAAGQRLTLATDVWSWGVSILDLFLGRVDRGFGAGAMLALNQHVEGGVRDQRCPAMPSGVVELLRRCFQNRPQHRPGTMLEIAEALGRLYLQATGQPYGRKWVEPAEALADSLNNRALSLHDSLDKRQEAEEKWQEALRVDSYHPEATYNLGLLQWRAGRITDEHLLAKLQQARPSCADPARVDYLLGLVHLERNDAASAIETLSKTESTAGGVEVASALVLAKARHSNTAQLLRTLKGHTERVLAAAWSPDGRFVASSSADGSMALWEVPSGRLLRRSWGEFYALAFSPDGRILLSGGVYPGTFRTGQWQRGPDGRFLLRCLCGNGGGMVGLWDAATGEFLRDIPRYAHWSLPSRGAGSAGGRHQQIVTAVAWSPDGRLALTACQDSVRLWEVAEGKCLHNLQGHTFVVHALAFSPDGRFALSCGLDATLRLWEISSGRSLRIFKAAPGQPTATAWRPDSHFALADPLERSWWAAKNSEQRQEPATPVVAWTTQRSWYASVQRPSPREGPISHGTALAWSVDGRFALSAGWDEVLRLWDLSTGAVRTFEGHKDTVTAVACNHDGRFALSGGADGTLRLWEISSGRCLRTVEGHSAMVTAVVWGPGGSLALSASADSTLRLWQLAPAAQRMPLAASRPAPVRSEYPRLLQQAREALAAGESARAADLLQRARQEPGCTRRADGMELARALSRFLGRGAFLSGWERQTLTGHCSAVTAVAWDPAGGRILSGGPCEAPRLWDVSTGRYLRSFGEGAVSATAVAWAPGGTHALSGGDDKQLQPKDVAGDGSKGLARSEMARIALEARRLRLWDVASGRCLRTLEGHLHEVTAVAWAPDGRHALSASGRRIRLWDVASGRCLRSFRGGLVTLYTTGPQHPLTPQRDAGLGPLSLLVREPDTWGCLLLLLGLPLLLGLRAWAEAMGLRLPPPFIGLSLLGLVAVVLMLFSKAGTSHKDRITSVAWAPDGRRAVSGGADREVRLWQVARGRCLRTLKGHTDTVTAVAWSPDGRGILSAGGDRTLRLWDASTGRCLRVFAHMSCVTAVAFSPDGCFALCGGADRTLHLWEVASGRCVHTLEGHTGWVTSVAFSPDGWQALSGSADHTVRVWQLDWELGYRPAT
jgi:WD40 repeat protein/serine/threonine protein kinase